MNRLLLLPLSIAFLALFVACGGGDAEQSTPNVTTPPGANGSLPKHLTQVEPAQNVTVTNADLHVGEANATGGICAHFDFTVGDGMGDKPTERVKMYLNREDVTASANWVVTLSQPPTGGTMCYAPPQDLPAGGQEVRVNYTESTDRRFTYVWTFDVAEATPSP